MMPPSSGGQGGMANFNCVEPAQQNATDHTVVSATAADQITFPAVDSCFAVALVLDNGTMLGGHVPTLWDDKAFQLEMSKSAVATVKGLAYDPNAGSMSIALGNVMSAVNTLRNGRKVVLAVTLGDPEWHDLWDATTVALVGYPKQIRYRKGGGPRNLIVDAVAQSISVQAKVGGLYATDPTKTRGFNQGTITVAPIAC